MILKVNWKLIKKETINGEGILQENKELNIGSTITAIFNLKHKLQAMSTTKVILYHNIASNCTFGTVVVFK